MASSSDDHPKQRLHAYGLVALFIALVLIGLLVRTRYAPPSARGADAPATEFSASRAQEVLTRILEGGRPHPVGSPANAEVRRRVIAEFERLGFSPETQDTFLCVGGECAHVSNVAARKAGRIASGAVLLSAHYDSVSAGAGVSDDGAGVAAILEVARALKAGPELLHDVIFLIDDGEEVGMLGAEAFASQHAWAKDVAVDINLEARGTSGPSLMFETSAHGRALAPVLQTALSRPVTTSLFADVYGQMPNDTDLTVFKRHGKQGFNLGFIRQATRYHTELDDAVDSGSLQHQGNHALELARAMANRDEKPSEGRAVWFDILALFIVWWPESWSLLIGIVACVALAASGVVVLRRSGSSAGHVLRGLALVPIGLCLTIGIAVAMQIALSRAGKLPRFVVLESAPLALVFWIAPVLALVPFSLVRSRKSDFWGLWVGTWLFWGMLTIGCAGLAPSGAHLFLVPMIVASLASVCAAARPRSVAAELGAASLPVIAAAIVWLPFAWILQDAIGILAPAIFSLAAAMIVLPMLPAVRAASRPARRYTTGAAAVTFALAVTFAFREDIHRRRDAEPIELYLLQSEGAQATWLLDGSREPLPPSVRNAAPFAPANDLLFPWFLYTPPSLWAAPAITPRLAAPELVLAQGLAPDPLDRAAGAETRLVQGRLSSRRGAPQASLWFSSPDRVRKVRLGGTEVPRLVGADTHRAWQGVIDYTLPPQGVEIEVEISGAAPLEVLVLDKSDGVPAEAGAIVRARAPEGVSIGDGDVTFVSQRQRL